MQTVIKAILEAATPTIKEELKEALDRLEEKAAETDNWVDDALVAAVKSITGC